VSLAAKRALAKRPRRTSPLHDHHKVMVCPIFSGNALYRAERALPPD
jgi:hypothetical protein